MTRSIATLALASLSIALAACGGERAPSANASAAQAPAGAASNGAAGDAGTMGNAATAAADVAYTCDPAMKLSVRYDAAAGTDGAALLTLDGKQYTLDHVQSGSGARYVTKAGRTAGRTLVWWNKGDDGMLMEGSAADPAAEEKTIASCSHAA